MKSTAQSHMPTNLKPASAASGTLATGKETFTVTFEAIDIDVAPIHMVIEGRPPPSAPSTPTTSETKLDTAPTLPIRIYLQPTSPMPTRRAHHDTQPTNDEDWFASDSGLVGAGDGRCEACGAVFASSRRQAFWKHIVLNKCRKRQALRGRSHLGQWWSGRKF